MRVLHAIWLRRLLSLGAMAVLLAILPPMLRTAPAALADEPATALTSAGTALTEGDELLGAAEARAQFGVDGSGVRVAVLSDGIRGLDVARSSEDAPGLAAACGFIGNSLTVVCNDDAVPLAGRYGTYEEGTALIEIVHDLAPGAQISFGAVATSVQHMAMVNHFAARVDIIVDNLSFLFRADQQSTVSRNTSAALRRADWPLRLYVTASGNWAASHWSGHWRAGVDGRELGLSSPGAVHRFTNDSGAPLSGMANGFEVSDGDEVQVALFWDDPRGRALNDYDLHVVSAAGSKLWTSDQRQGTSENWDAAHELVSFRYEGPDTELYVVIQNHRDEADPVRFDLFAVRPGGSEPQLRFRTAESSLLAQSDAAGALTVGAVNAGQVAVAAYSSEGPTLNGQPKPEIAGLDSITVSDATSYGTRPSFAGSSAAAPHVAGIAALLLEAQPALRSADGGDADFERWLVRQLLQTTADDLPRSSYGLVNARAAIDLARSSVVSVTSSADSGAGSLRSALRQGTRYIVCDETVNSRTIVLQSPLPHLGEQRQIACPGWTIDASAVEVGLQLEGRSGVRGLTVIGAQTAGVRVAGGNVELQGVTAARNGVGALIEGSATITEGTFRDNERAGVRITAAASSVRLGSDGTLPLLIPASSRLAPIGPLPLPQMEGREGLSHVLRGAVFVDGVPAAAGTTVEAYLDRRFAGSVVVNERSEYALSVAGPGAEVRFAIDGAPTYVVNAAGEAEGLRVPFGSGQVTELTLRAERPGRMISPFSDDGFAGDSLFVGNGAGIELDYDARIADSPSVLMSAGRFVGNAVNVATVLQGPTIEGWRLTPAGLSLWGNAGDADAVSLFAGSDGERVGIGSVNAPGGRYRITDAAIDDTVTEFSVLGHAGRAVATRESDVVTLPPAGLISRVSPAFGHVSGGEQVEVCGADLGTDREHPQVWFGSAPAAVTSFGSECVQVTTPAMAGGAVDVTVLPPSGRLLVASDGFTFGQQVVQLQQGTNQVVWRGPATSAAKAFASISDAEFIAYSWQSETQQWHVYSPNLPSRLNSLKLLEHDEPLWIELKSAGAVWTALHD